MSQEIIYICPACGAETVIAEGVTRCSGCKTALPHEEPPAEITAYASDVRDLLGLQAWTIHVKMVDDLGDKEGDEVGGDCTYTEPYRHAQIHLKRGLSPEQYREYLMHEMLHIALAPLDYTARGLGILFRGKMAEYVERTLDDACERVVTPLAKALVKGIKSPPQEPIP